MLVLYALEFGNVVICEVIDPTKAPKLLGQVTVRQWQHWNPQERIQISPMILSRNNKRVAAVVYHRIFVWDISNTVSEYFGEASQNVPAEGQGRTGMLLAVFCGETYQRFVHICFVDDENNDRVVTSNFRGEVSLWDVNANSCLHTIQSSAPLINVCSLPRVSTTTTAAGESNNPFENTVLMATRTGQVSLCDATHDTNMLTVKMETQLLRGDMLRIAINTDCTIALVVGLSHQVTLFAIETSDTGVTFRECHTFTFPASDYIFLCQFISPKILLINEWGQRRLSVYDIETTLLVTVDFPTDFTAIDATTPDDGAGPIMLVVAFINGELRTYAVDPVTQDKDDKVKLVSVMQLPQKYAQAIKAVQKPHTVVLM